jgi:flagellar basal body rod protein FlgG
LDIVKIAADSMQRDLQKMQHISQNLANVLTPGYKRQMSVEQGFAAQMEQGLAASPVPAIDARAGTLRYTGVAQDIAVEGSAFFEISAPEGRRFSRQGALHVDSAGRLVGVHGFPLMGAGGEIVLTPGPFTIDPSGQVLQDGRVAGQLKLVSFSKASQLQPVGAGLYAQGGAVEELAAPATVRVGFLENSNVESAHEMVGMTETVRHFEALARIAQGYDEALGTTFRKLGEF